ncbi:hypothetical protein HanIR_Chr03g0130081 [Helianthus annuus]|nr:hypothetical protein HanIR_Chr03g0130081 [Helianthus annuus]
MHIPAIGITIMIACQAACDITAMMPRSCMTANTNDPICQRKTWVTGKWRSAFCGRDEWLPYTQRLQEASLLQVCITHIQLLNLHKQ